MLLKASAPGSLMLLGEYAVLHGKQALVCAIDRRITVTISPRVDQTICLFSSLGQVELSLSDLKMIAPFQFVLAVLIEFKDYLKQGCDITIESEFSETLGLASSAAVTVSTLAAVTAWLGLAFSKKQLAQKARDVIRSVQTIGSGADAAACVMGGMVSYRAGPFLLEKLPFIYPITVSYSGSKTPTVQAVKFVEEKFSAFPHLFKQLMESIDHCAREGMLAVMQQNWLKLGNIMNVQQGLMDALGVNTDNLNRLVQRMRGMTAILGAKISGSGLGDCVVGLGEALLEDALPVKMTEQGVVCEKI